MKNNYSLLKWNENAIILFKYNYITTFLKGIIMVKEMGIDAGGTLTKIAYIDSTGELILKNFPSNDLRVPAQFINQFTELEVIGITGGRAEQLNQFITINPKTVGLVEFEATMEGVKFLLSQEKSDIEDAIITNIGSGTSIHHMKYDEYTRVGGTGVGGGTLVGLSALLTGVNSYQEMSNLAQSGTRKGIDLMVADIFQGQEIPAPLNPDLTASNFGQAGIKLNETYKDEDLLATVARLVGEVITTLSIQLADQFKTESIVYIGTTLKDHPVLQYVIEDYTTLKKKKAIFLDDRGYSGAIGALKKIV